MRKRMRKNLGMWIAATLSAVAGSAMAVVVGSAGADVPSGNLIRNPDAETGTTAMFTSPSPPPPEWTRTRGFSLIGYADIFWDTPTLTGGGSAFFAGGPATFMIGAATASQDIDIAAAAPEVDAGRVSATLAADLGGSGTIADSMAVVASFFGPARAPLASMQIGPVTAADRGNVTSFLRRSATAAVPRGTRLVQVVMTSNNVAADSQNTGYADNLSLTLRATPLPGPPGTTPTPAGFPLPKLGVSFNVAPLRGRVFISTPPGSAARAAASVPGLKGRNFVPLRAVRNVPVGSLLDTRRGAVAIASERDASGKIQTGEFASGVFQVLQSRRRSARGLTELRLRGASFRRCRTRARKGSARSFVRAETSRRSRRRIRRLRGKTTGGRFRTRGRYSAATVRGTDWTTTDRCDGTLTRVRRGRVAVRDFRKRKNVLVRQGKSYLARAPG